MTAAVNTVLCVLSHLQVLAFCGEAGLAGPVAGAVQADEVLEVLALRAEKPNGCHCGLVLFISVQMERLLKGS